MSEPILHDGAVVKNHGYSDWSLQDFPCPESALRLRMVRHGADVQVEFAPAGGGPWKSMRVARLNWPEDAPLRAGLYACSPKGPGFRAVFAFLRVELSLTPTRHP